MTWRRPTERLASSGRWVGVAVLICAAPKCLLCLLVLTGALTTVVGPEAAEFCGGTSRHLLGPALGLPGVALLVFLGRHQLGRRVAIVRKFAVPWFRTVRTGRG